MSSTLYPNWGHVQSLSQHCLRRLNWRLVFHRSTAKKITNFDLVFVSCTTYNMLRYCPHFLIHSTIYTSREIQWHEKWWAARKQTAGSRKKNVVIFLVMENIWTSLFCYELIYSLIYYYLPSVSLHLAYRHSKWMV